jgi:hypothetical protein
MSMVSDAELNRIAIKGLKDYSSLDEIDWDLWPRKWRR